MIKWFTVNVGYHSGLVRSISVDLVHSCRVAIVPEEGAIRRVDRQCRNVRRRWKKLMCFRRCQPVGVVVKDIAIGAGGSGFDSQTGQSEHSVATDRHRCDAFSELCCSGAKLR